MPTKNYADAMLDVLSKFMDEDPNFVVMGNEVLGIGPEGMQFEPFQKKYGDRILFPPCSEAAYTAMAAGAAMCGHRMFAHLGLASFTYPAISSIANEISTARTSSGGTIGVPVTLHISHGLLHGGGAQHSEAVRHVLEPAGDRDRGSLRGQGGQGTADNRDEVGQPDHRAHPRLWLRS